MKLAVLMTLPLAALACSSTADNAAPSPTAPPAPLARPAPPARRAGPPAQHPAPARSDNGERIYGIYCASCHGTAGRGDGPAARALTPRPADLTLRGPPQSRQPRWQTILRGSPGTAMPGFANILTGAQLADLHTFLSELRHANRGAPGGPGGPGCRP